MASNTSWQVKKKYNAKVYKTVSTQLPKDLVEQFREVVKQNGDSQAQIIKSALEEYIAKNAGN